MFLETIQTQPNIHSILPSRVHTSMPPVHRYQVWLRQSLKMKPDRLRSKPYDTQMRSDIVYYMLGKWSALETMVGLELPVTVLHKARDVPCLRTIYRVHRCILLNGRASCARGRGGTGSSLRYSQIVTLKKWFRVPDGKKRGTRLRMTCVWFEKVYEHRPSHTKMCRWLCELKLTRKKGTRVADQQDPECVSLF